MLDPIGAFTRIRDFYISYLETAFYIRDSAVSDARRRLLESSSALCTEPIIEPLTRYETAVFALEDLVHSGSDDPRLPGLTAIEREAFVRLALSGLFESKGFANGLPRSSYRPFEHQAAMLRRGVCSGQPAIVTSGTGSGKTEAFLLPVFARLAKEAIKWPAPENHYLSHRWWQDALGQPFTKYTALANRPSRRDPDASPFVPQRSGERRPAAVRSLILYPMNALVEDQLARLRRALDSEEARACMIGSFNKNRLFLGKYTSATPVTGHHRDLNGDTEEYKRRDRKLQKLFRASCQMQRTQEAARVHKDKDAHYLFPSVDGHEMTSRWDMQDAPPDILITNTSMLNAMLAREVDAPIFQKTRDWLLSNDDAYFFLVLDELHLQRGSAGTEVSLLLRLLIERLGLDDPKHRHKLHILASSASMPMQGELGEASLQYLWDFFGSSGTWSASEESGGRTKSIWREAIIEGTPLPVLPVRAISNLEPLIQLLRDSTGSGDSLAHPRHPKDAEAIWSVDCPIFCTSEELV
jgi:DEAD/DEAH box helicase domain-containing protein